MNLCRFDWINEEEVFMVLPQSKTQTSEVERKIDFVYVNLAGDKMMNRRCGVRY